MIASIIISYGVEDAFSSEKKAKSLLNKQTISIPSKDEDVKINKKRIVTITQIHNFLQKNNKELEIMKSQINQNKYTLKSKIAAWYPNFNLSSNGLPQYLSGSVDNELSSNTSSSQWKNGISATIQWDLINPSRIPDIDEAKDQLEFSKLAYLIKYRETYLNSLTKFFLLQKSNEYIRIAKESVKTSKNSLKEAEIRLESGIGTKFEVLEAKAQLAKDNQFLIKKIGEKKINERGLAKVLNLDKNTNPIIISKPKKIGTWNSSLEESIVNAISFREEIDQAKIQISINDNKAKSISGSNKPKISLYNTYSTSFAQGEANAINPNDSNSIYSQSNTVGLKFDWKIFNGGSVNANFKAKKAKNNELLSNLDLKKSQIRNEIEESFFNLEIAEENIVNTLQEVEAAKESLRLAIIRLKAGITTQREVVTNQRDLTQAEVNYIEAITDYNLNLVKLRQQTGIDMMQKCIIKSGQNKSKEYKTYSDKICVEIL